MAILFNQAVEVNPCFLFETNSPSESPSMNPWRRRQSEGVAHWWRFDEKILRDRGETATLEVKIGAVTAREPIFKGCRKKGLLIT